MNGHQVHKTHADPQPRREGKLITSASPPAPTLKFRSGPACQGSQSHCPHPGKLQTYSTHWLCSSSRNPLRTQVGRFSVLENPLNSPMAHRTSQGSSCWTGQPGTLYRRVGGTMVKRARSLCPAVHFSHSKSDQNQPEDPQSPRNP